MWIWLIVTAIFIWLAAVTFFLFRAIRNYNALTEGVSQKSLSTLLNDFIVKQKEAGDEARHLRQEIANLQRKGELHLQHVGIVRFNPFADTGGDQSFALAVLDERHTGIIITSLYSRMGIRWYIKTIKNGKPVEHELSKEEGEAVKKAMKSGS